ncbi:MAG TPA: alpha/beta hydrolase [Candidatus Angelobacter sp.]|nr:alpha/beta hydrolase [Candidatus Angelobacter sp.]
MSWLFVALTCFLLSSRRMKVASALFLLAVALVHAQSPTPPVPGRLVDLGGYRLHLNCTGRGKPTVVFSPGAGDFSFDWYLVQSEVAKFTRACSYDRGGEAWSDLGPAPRTIHQEAYDLGRLLHKAKEKGPFILVGQSAGGPVIRLFQQRYPQDVTAMVLVDAFHEDGRLFINGKLQKLRDLAKDRPVPQVRDHSGPGDGLSDEGIAKIKEAIVKYDMKPTIDPPFDKLPPEIQKLRLWALAKYSHFVALDNDFNAEEAETFFKDHQQNPQPLGDIPLIVLSRSRDEYPARFAEQLSAEHRAQQVELAALSRHARQMIVPESGHHIQLDQPRAVVDAIREAISEATHSPAASPLH